MMELVHSSKIDYSGNFTIKFRNKAELEILQNFFGVRRTKFDMALLDKRPDLLAKLAPSTPKKLMEDVFNIEDNFFCV